MAHTTLVLGLGDMRRGDDGFGPRVLAELQRRYRLDPHVLTIEATGVGLRLIPLLSTAQHLLLVTAVGLGAVPGALHHLAWHGQPEDLGPRLPAIRRTGVELLRSLHFFVDPVPELLVLGIESEVSTGSELSPLVALAVHPTVEECVAVLRGWGHTAEPKPIAAERVGA